MSNGFAVVGDGEVCDGEVAVNAVSVVDADAVELIEEFGVKGDDEGLGVEPGFDVVMRVAMVVADDDVIGMPLDDGGVGVGMVRFHEAGCTSWVRRCLRREW